MCSTDDYLPFPATAQSCSFSGQGNNRLELCCNDQSGVGSLVVAQFSVSAAASSGGHPSSLAVMCFASSCVKNLGARCSCLACDDLIGKNLP